MSGRAFSVAGREISPSSEAFVIAEVGINHEGSMAKAKKMIYDAYYAGCECVKFQCHIPEKEMTKIAKRVVPSNADVNIYDLIDRCSMNEEQERELKDLVESLGMIYLCTPFSIAAVDRLERLDVQGYKIGSGEMNNLQLIEYVAKKGKPMIVSTGMNNLSSIKKTVECIQNTGTQFCLLHCVSAYPTPYKNVNLPGVKDLQKAFPDVQIGLSDHSIGIVSCLGAYMLGCRVFEKHYTSDKAWPGPDIEISIDASDLKHLIADLHILKLCNSGPGREKTQEIEEPCMQFAFCTATTTRALAKGHVITEADIIFKRPNIGDFLSKDVSKLVGKSLTKDLEADQKFFVADVEKAQKKARHE